MTEQELKECIAEVKHSDIPESSKKKIMNVLYEQLHKEEWIPCSERMPEIYENVLGQFHVQDEQGIKVCMSILSVDYDGRWTDDHDYTPFGKVIAWQPLPEPYKGEERKEV